jgi:hypothetical protein
MPLPRPHHPAKIRFFMGEAILIIMKIVQVHLFESPEENRGGAGSVF